MPVERRRVTDLVEFDAPEEVAVDERQLEFEWPLSARLEAPPMTARVMNAEKKPVSRRRAS